MHTASLGAFTCMGETRSPRQIRLHGTSGTNLDQKQLISQSTRQSVATIVFIKKSFKAICQAEKPDRHLMLPAPQIRAASLCNKLNIFMCVTFLYFLKYI